MTNHIIKKSGISLIVLIITIILMIVLAGTVIITLNNNGIINKAEGAVKNNNYAQEKYGITLALMNAQIGKNGYEEITQTNFQREIDDQFGRDKAIVIVNDNESWRIIFNNDRMYYVENSGLIIDDDHILKITTARELKQFRDEVNNGNSFDNEYVYLANNIQLEITEAWTPIGIYHSVDSEDNKPFKGVFDGSNYEINGININTTEKSQSIFGLVEEANIKNLTLGENNIIIGDLATAGIVGYAYNGTKIYNCHNKCDIQSSGKSVGGIVGVANKNVVVANCSNKGTITGKDTIVGGIVANCLYGSIINASVNMGNIIGQNDIVGGIVGTAQYNSMITNNYNISEIKSVDHVYLGGIVGYLYEACVVSNCYNLGSITGGGSNINGIAGYVGESKINNNYYLKDVVVNSEDMNNIRGVEAKTEEQLKNATSILGSEYKEDTGINNGYPILKWQ